MDAMNDNRLLIVDDDKDTCSNLSDILGDLGYAVDVAYRGQEALDLFEHHDYGLALLDYKLPCMTGVQLFQKMRELRQGIRGLLVTAFASSETESEALSAGLRQVVSKPVEMSTFLPMIEQSLA
jgi:two-component system nitrogen regulation response regulator GlnG